MQVEQIDRIGICGLLFDIAIVLGYDFKLEQTKEVAPVQDYKVTLLKNNLELFVYELDTTDTAGNVESVHLLTTCVAMTGNECNVRTHIFDEYEASEQIVQLLTYKQIEHKPDVKQHKPDVKAKQLSPAALDVKARGKPSKHVYRDTPRPAVKVRSSKVLTLLERSGKQLRELRESLSLSQKALALILCDIPVTKIGGKFVVAEIKPSSISLIERGTRSKGIDSYAIRQFLTDRKLKNELDAVIARLMV